MRWVFILLLIVCLNSGCASYFVGQIGCTEEYKTPSGAVVWDDGNISVKERTVRKSVFTGRRKVLSERHYFMGVEDIISFQETPSSKRVMVGYKYTKYPTDSNDPYSLRTDELLTVPENRKEEGCSVYVHVDNIPYSFKGKGDLRLSFDPDGYGIVGYGRNEKKSLTGKVLYPVLFIPAIAVDVALSPVYLLLITTQLSDIAN